MRSISAAPLRSEIVSLGRIDVLQRRETTEILVPSLTKLLHLATPLTIAISVVTVVFWTVIRLDWFHFIPRFVNRNRTYLESQEGNTTNGSAHNGNPHPCGITKLTPFGSLVGVVPRNPYLNSSEAS
jgi:hypothetical protein